MSRKLGNLLLLCRHESASVGDESLVQSKSAGNINPAAVAWHSMNQTKSRLQAGLVKLNARIGYARSCCRVHLQTIVVSGHHSQDSLIPQALDNGNSQSRTLCRIG